jgi:hypothetical protein
VDTSEVVAIASVILTAVTGGLAAVWKRGNDERDKLMTAHETEKAAMRTAHETEKEALRKALTFEQSERIKDCKEFTVSVLSIQSQVITTVNESKNSDAQVVMAINENTKVTKELTERLMGESAPVPPTGGGRPPLRSRS